MTREIIQEKIIGLLSKAGFKEDAVSVMYDERMNTIWFSVNASDARLLLGREAEALGAINHLASKIAERLTLGQEDHPRVVIDANDFERKKIENLKTVAHMMAERARYFKSSIDVEPMPPHERRIVHEFLSDVPDMHTESAGEGKDRHVVIKYVDPKI